MRSQINLGIQDELDDSVAVAQVDEDHAAVIATRLHPSPERDFAPGVGGAQCAAIVGALPRRQRRVNFTFGHHTSRVEEGYLCLNA